MGGPGFALILVKGHPGTGKSTLAKQVAKALACAVVDKDDARDTLQRLSGSLSPSDMNDVSYDIMFAITKTQLGMGHTVIVDCPFARKSLYTRAEELAVQVGARLILLDVTCGDEHIWRQRLEQRAAEDAGTARCHKPSSWAALQDLLARYNGECNWSTDGSVDLSACLVLPVDTANKGSVDAAIAAVIKHAKTIS